MSVNYEVKGQLAKLLATEDLIVENRQVSTASFDVHRRVLTLPLWEKASGTVYDLLVGHEVGHALYTPDRIWIEEYPDVPPSFVNVIEDVRVERLIKAKFPGLAKTFYSGYLELSNEDFFGIESEDISTYSLIDRINLQSKIGNFIKVPFSDEEKIYLKRSLKVQSFDEVLVLANDIVKFINQSKEEIDLKSLPDPSGSSSEAFNAPGGGLDVDSSFGDDFEESSDSTEEGESVDSNTESKPQNFSGGTTNNNMESLTDKILKENLEELCNKLEMGEHVYVEFPDVDMDTVVIKNEKVHKFLQNFYDETEERLYCPTVPNIFEEPDQEYSKFRLSAQKEVNYLVKEFECHKAADSYSRSSLSRTGVLDMNSLHTYKWNEDIFKKITTIADGQNHGLVFVLDWSGSMSEVLGDTYRQLLNLMWFCRKCSIPFVVYAFTTEWAKVSYEFDEKTGKRYPKYPPQHHKKETGNILIPEEFSLLELFDSKVRSSVFENQVRNIWRLVYSLDSHRYYCRYQYPLQLSLSGTPLNEALICMTKAIPKFKKEHNLQKVQCIVLTDGEAPPIRYLTEHPIKNAETGETEWNIRIRSLTSLGKFYIRDRKSGITKLVPFGTKDLTKAILECLQHRFLDVNFIGIRILLSREASSFIRGYDQHNFEKNIEFWRKNKTIVLKNTGYNAYFGLSSSALNVDSEFEVSEDASKSQIRSAFKKSLGAKKTNKKILNEFVKLIA